MCRKNASRPVQNDLVNSPGNSTEPTSPVHGPAIKAARNDAHLTQTALAERARVSLPTIQRAERSDPTITRRTMLAIAQALDVDLAVLYDDPTPPARRAASDGADLAPVVDAMAEQARAIGDIRALAEDIPAMRAMMQTLVQDMAVVRAYIEDQQAREAHA